MLLTKLLHSGPAVDVPEMVQSAEIPSFVIFCIALAALCLLAVNAGLVIWCIIRKRAKGKCNHPP